MNFVTDIVLHLGRKIAGFWGGKNILYFLAKKFGSIRKNVYLCNVFQRVVKRWQNEASVMTGPKHQ